MSTPQARSIHSTAPATGAADTQHEVGWLSKLGQNWNSQGILLFLEVAFSKPELAMPHVSVPDIRWLDWSAVKASGFEAVVFDKDNTLTSPYSKAVHEKGVLSLEDCMKVFPGKVALLSNSAGLLEYDRDGSVASDLEQSLGVPVIRHNSKKPGGSADAVERHLGCAAEQIVFVGDRYLTDVLYGNRNGMLTVRTAPLEPHLDPLVVRQVRSLEDALLHYWTAQKVKAPEHRLLQNKSSFKLLKEPACW